MKLISRGRLWILNLLTLALLTISNDGYSQWTIYLSGTVGSYAMGDMKEIQSGLIDDFNASGIRTRAVTEFPISLQIEGGADRLTSDKVTIGGFFNFAMTKGRVHYSDYSGETYGDQNVSRIFLGGSAARLLESGFSIYGKVGINYSTLSMDFSTRIDGLGSDTELLDFYSIGVGAEPGIAWGLARGKIGFRVNAGYEINVQGKTIFRENSEAYLLKDGDEKALMNWSGVRVGLALTYAVH